MGEGEAHTEPFIAGNKLKGKKRKVGKQGQLTQKGNYAKESGYSHSGYPLSLPVLPTLCSQCSPGTTNLPFSFMQSCSICDKITGNIQLCKESMIWHHLRITLRQV